MSKGVEMTYGKGAGCGFLTKGCLSYRKYPFSFEEIDSSKAIRCNANREYAESVGIYRYGGLRPEQRYFKDGTKGGNKYADMCPVWSVSYSK